MRKQYWGVLFVLIDFLLLKGKYHIYFADFWVNGGLGEKESAFNFGCFEMVEEKAM